MSSPETFLQRWARRKTEQVALRVPDSPVDRSLPEPEMAVQTTLPSLADVGALLADADYSRFIATGVDKVVHRAAMKKLFAEPHFNVMDGLDIYIADYNVASPVSAGMLASFAHAHTTLNPTAAWQSAGAETVPLPVRTAPESAQQDTDAAGQDDAAEAGGAPGIGRKDDLIDADASPSDAAVQGSAHASCRDDDLGMRTPDLRSAQP